MYGYTPSWALEWNYRRGLIMAELLKHQADFLCLQEVQTAQYEEYFVPKLNNAGYEGVYYPKSRYKTMNEADRKLVDGCAIFFNKSRYVCHIRLSCAVF
jgi:CCR4-NOT transcription complex subunit 6